MPRSSASRPGANSDRDDDFRKDPANRAPGWYRWTVRTAAAVRPDPSGAG
jgi:hypothetical protein